MNSYQVSLLSAVPEDAASLVEYNLLPSPLQMVKDGEVATPLESSLPQANVDGHSQSQTPTVAEHNLCRGK